MPDSLLPDQSGKRASSRLCLAIFFVAAAGAMAAYAPKAVEASHNADFERYYHAGTVALRGGDIYEATDDKQFKYFPVFAQLMLPVAYYGSRQCCDCHDGYKYALRAAARLWYVILCASFLGSLWLTLSLAKPTCTKEALLLAVIAAAFSARFFVANVRNGQINLPVMFLAVLGCWLAARKHEKLGGAALALAACIKFMPVVLLLWFARRGWWQGIGAFLVTALFLLLVAPAATWGFRGNVELLQSYVDSRHKMVTGMPEDEAPGQSAPSLANRLLRKVNAASLRRVDEQGNRAPIYINLLDLPPQVVHAVAVALVLLLCVLAWRGLAKTGDENMQLLLEIGLMFILMLLISPEARKAHYVTTMLPAAGATLWFLRNGGGLYGKMFFVFSFLLLAFSSQGVLGEGDFYDYANACGIIAVGGVILFGLLLRFLKNSHPKDSSVR